MQMKVLSRCVMTCVAAVNAAELMRIVDALIKPGFTSGVRGFKHSRAKSHKPNLLHLVGLIREGSRFSLQRWVCADGTVKSAAAWCCITYAPQSALFFASVPAAVVQHSWLKFLKSSSLQFMWKKQETTESPEARLLFSPGFLVQTSD